MLRAVLLIDLSRNDLIPAAKYRGDSKRHMKKLIDEYLSIFHFSETHATEVNAPVNSEYITSSRRLYYWLGYSSDNSYNFVYGFRRRFFKARLIHLNVPPTYNYLLQNRNTD
jgi:hypothetical protein